MRLKMAYEALQEWRIEAMEQRRMRLKMAYADAPHVSWHMLTYAYV